jgi:RNA 2',3'-cyclic 3'-phosphodiesterase
VATANEPARLFAALELSEEAVVALHSWSEAQLASVSGLRLAGRAALHVTLCFLGAQPTAEIEAIADACRVVAGRGHVDLQLGAPVWLPHRRPRVLAVRLQDISGALAELQRVLATELERGGWYEREARPFLPHVTMGRFRRTAGRAVELVPPPPVVFEGVSVALLRSRPGPGGSRYERLVSVGLSAGATG